MSGRRALGVGVLLVALTASCANYSSAAVQRQPGELDEIDYVIAPASAELVDEIARSTLVDEFARLPKGSVLDAGMGTTSFSGIGDTVCALQDGDGIAVTTADDITRKMMLTLVADRARVYESPGGDFRFRDVNPRRQAQVEIQLSIDAKAAAADAIHEALNNDPAVASVEYVDHQEAYKQFRRDFGDEPGVLDAPRPGNFPESFRVAVKAGADVEAFAQRYQRRPGVEYLQRPYDVCENSTP